MRCQLLYATLVVTAGLISTAKADFTSGLINVDFNFTTQAATQTGAAAFGAPGDVWNPELNFAAHTSGILNLATGSPSNSVTYAVAGVNHAIIGATAFGSTPFAALMSDAYIVSPAQTMTISFNGLTAFQPYDLYFYSSAANPAGTDIRTTTFATAAAILTAANSGAPTTLIEANNFVHFRSQPADAAGHISVAIQGTGGNVIFDPQTLGGIVNGFQIAPVPEPSTIMLISVGGLLLGAAYRRRRG